MRRGIILLLLTACGVASGQSVSVRSGASLPEGLCGVNMSCDVASLTSAGSITSGAASGQFAFKPTVAGARVAMGPGTNQWWSCPSGVYCATDALLWLGGGIDMRNSTINDSFAGVVRINSANGFGIAVQGATVPECGASPVSSGPTQRVPPGSMFPATGSAKPTRLCFCTYDGMTYKWFNLLNPTDTNGTSTTCPEYP